ncbi:integrase [Kribbella soli]|uniref:Integrase n=2 Tax=Kribbella soli TaxID=1124743 RepID=A0A4R0HLM4_9ACTN|nr:integrase [Kribbella soli]
MKLSYDVRTFKTEVYKGKRTTSYRVRWSVAGVRFKETFATKKLAESFLAKLTTAAREGTAFDVASGLPLPMAKDLHRRSWYRHACEYVDLKWPRISPGHRRGISETLTQATFALLTTDRGRPADAAIRVALHSWAFSRANRGGLDIADADPPAGIAPVIRWLESNTADLSEFADSAVVRRVLNQLALRQDGKATSASTIARRRATFHGALQYGVELKYFVVNPMESISWAAPRQDDEVDRRVLANPTQIKSLLGAVRTIYPSLEAFYGGMYYAAMRPAEVRHLARHHLHLPDDESEWGELLLDGSTQQTGQAWSDTGAVREDRPLKHRSERSTRAVPIYPEYCALLRRHLELFGTGPDGRLFVTRTGPFGHVVPLVEYSNPVHPNTSTRFWDKARKKALSEEQYASPLARRPYDLRHAGVSLWLNAGVPATQVAEWAGHSVKVLLQVYAGCIDGQDEAARRRIAAALAGDAA